MLMRGDFDLNSTPRYADSLREALKETMLNQELVFRKQVHELHRLYVTQKSLTDDLSWKELNNYNSWKATTQLTPELHASSIGYSMAEERTFSGMPLVDSTRSIDQGMSGECMSSYNKDQHQLPEYQQGPLDLRIPSERYVGRVGDDFPMSGHTWNSPLGVNKYSLVGDNVSDSGEVNLSPGVGEDIRTKELDMTWYGRKAYPCSQEVIDLEKCIERISNEGARPVVTHDFAAPTIYYRKEQDFQVSVVYNSFLSKSEKKDPAEVITLVDGCGSSPEWSSFNPGPLVCHDDLPCENLLTKKQRLTSCGTRDIDLNKVQLDDSSCYSNDSLMVYPSTASSSVVLHGVVDESVEGTHGAPTCSIKCASKWSNGTSDMPQQNRSFYPPLVGSEDKDNSKGETVSGYIDLESVPGSPLDPCEIPCICRSHLENENTDLPLESSNSLLYDQSREIVVTAQLNPEESKMQGLAYSFPYQSQDTEQAVSISCAEENNSSSAKSMKSGIQLGDLNVSTSNDFSEILLGSEVAETVPGEQDLRSCHSSELEQQCNGKKEESPEVHVLIKKAAESLVHLSLESSVCYPDCASKATSGEMENDKEEQPEYSCDSYESIVRKLTESSVDDYCITSESFEMNEIEKKDFGTKLKRGRRMKDFQKDILPGLASLSRQEIREDINIMEGVIRSREYRKNRAKMGDGGSWPTPVRSRRSRSQYIGRRK